MLLTFRLISTLTAVFFLGGWASPFEGIAYFEPWHDNIWFGWIFGGGFPWLFIKMAFFMYTFFWLRATFPRYRYDQIMRLGWKVFIPVTIVWIGVEGAMAWFEIGPWANLSGQGDGKSNQLRQDVCPVGASEGAQRYAAQLLPPQRDDRVPRGEDAAVASFPRPARAQALPEW